MVKFADKGSGWHGDSVGHSNAKKFGMARFQDEEPLTSGIRDYRKQRIYRKA